MLKSNAGKHCLLIKLLDFGMKVMVLNLSGLTDHCSLSPVMFNVYGAQHCYTNRVQGVLAKIVKCYVCISTGGNKNNIFETDGTNFSVYEFL